MELETQKWIGEKTYSRKIHPLHKVAPTSRMPLHPGEKAGLEGQVNVSTMTAAMNLMRKILEESSECVLTTCRKTTQIS